MTTRRAAARDLLPPGRLRVRAAWLRKLAILLGIVGLLGAIFLGLGLYALSELAEVRADRALWDRGTPASEVSVTGKQRSRAGLSWLLASYDLEVRFVDEAGATHTGRTEFGTAFGGPDTDAQPTVRYDAAAPERYVLSWAIDGDGEGARQRRAVFLGGLGLALAALMAFVLWLEAGRIACVRDGDELVVDVLRSEVLAGEGGKAPTMRQLTLRARDVPGAKPWTEHRLLDAPPLLFANAAKTAIVALRRRRHTVLLEYDLAPIELPDGERKAIAQRFVDRALAERGPGRATPVPTAVPSPEAPGAVARQGTNTIDQ